MKSRGGHVVEIKPGGVLGWFPTFLGRFRALYTRLVCAFDERKRQHGQGWERKQAPTEEEKVIGIRSERSYGRDMGPVHTLHTITALALLSLFPPSF